MSTFNLPKTSIPVTINSPSDLSEDEVISFSPFKNWLTTLQSSLSQQSSPSHTFHSNPYSLKSITVQAHDRFGQRIGFLKLSATITNTSGEALPGAVFLRGPSVAMLMILQPDDLPKDSEREKYVLLTVQPRPAAGSLGFVELPAGMVDGGSFKGAAAKEIEEELGMSVQEEELIDLTELALEDESGQGGEGLAKAFFPSVGACDEFIRVFLCQKRVKRESLSEWTGKLTGLRDEGEKITLKLIKLEELWREGARDAKALSAWALLEGLKRTGKL